LIAIKKRGDNPKNKRKWNLVYIEDEEETVIVELTLVTSSLTNKFIVIQKLFEEMNDIVPEFSGWYRDIVREYIDSGYNAEIIMDSVPEMINMASEYLENKTVFNRDNVEVPLLTHFESFVDLKKASKTSILFEVADIKAISLTSTALKIYSIFCYDVNLKVPENIDRLIYDKMIHPCVEAGTTTKIFELIRSRTYRSSITDRFMWDMIKLMVSETPESYVMTTFNFLMKNLISIISVEKNPVLYLIGTIDYAIKWLMASAYEDKIIYGEAFGSSEDIYGSGVSKESFHLYCCNDVIAKVASAGMFCLENQWGLNDLRAEQQETSGRLLELKENVPASSPEYKELDRKNEKLFEELNKLEGGLAQSRDRIDALTYLFPPMRLLTLPIASRVFEIPYKFLLAAAPKHVMLMGIFLYELTDGIMREDFPILSEFLISCPENANFLSTRSSYKIRNLEFILNDKNPIFGFNSKSLKFEIMSSICGVLSASKKNVVSVIDGSKLSKITYLDLESDVTEFYIKLYSGNLDKIFDKMRSKSNEYFK